MCLLFACISEEDDVVELPEDAKAEPQTRGKNISERVSNKKKERKNRNK